MDIERDRCVRAFTEAGMRDADDFLGLYGQKGDFLALEEGRIDAAEFRKRVRGLFDRPVTDAEIDTAFQEFLIGIPQRRLEALRELGRDYNMCLLSNTNPIMWEGKIRSEFAKEGLTVDHYFPGGVFTSFEAKAYKPAREIFDYAAARGGLVPAETLFFDDSQANVDAARSYGYRAVLVKPGDEFVDLLAKGDW